jgi:hypothetical protein
MLINTRKWFGPASLIWVIVLVIFLIVPLFPKLWFSNIWPMTLLILTIVDIIAMGFAIKVAPDPEGGWTRIRQVTPNELLDALRH